MGQLHRVVPITRLVALAWVLPLTATSTALADARLLPSPTVYNATPRCAPSTANPVCGPWDVPRHPGSLFPTAFGQCTYWAYEKRPDIWDGSSVTDPQTDWTAWTWTEHARSENLAVDGVPQVGDVAVWSAASLRNETGHVAYVEEVEPGGSIVVSEMNGSFPFRGDNRLISRSTYTSQHAQFIHRTTTTAPSKAPLPVAELTLVRAAVTRGRLSLAVALVRGSGTVHATVLGVRSRGARLHAIRRGPRFTFATKMHPGQWMINVMLVPGPGWRGRRYLFPLIVLPGSGAYLAQALIAATAA